jgi:hypothetical protein
MTLLITAASRDVIYQSADFRLSDLRNGEVITDRSTKLVTLTYTDWQGFITYTGIGSWDGIDTSALIVRWLAGNSEISPDEVEQLLQGKGGSWLARMAGRLGPQRHTFVFGCFDSAGARVSVISNFEDGQGRTDRVPARQLIVTRLRPTLKPTVVVCGAKKAISRSSLARLRRLLRPGAADPARVRTFLSELNREGATRSAYGSTVSENCSVVSIRRDGHGVNSIAGAVELRAVMNGMAAPTQAELEKMLGFKLGTIVGAGSGIAGGVAIPYAPCNPVTIKGDEPSHVLREWSHPDFESLRPVDVSNSGIVFGVGDRRGTQGAPLVWRGASPDQIEVSDFVAGYGGVNDAGVVVTSAHTAEGLNHAALWTSTETYDLSFEAEHRSAAVAINASGLVVGSLTINGRENGQAGERPAAWMPDGNTHILEDFGAEYGAAVDVNDDGLVLVAGHNGMTTVPILWNASTGEFWIVGGDIGVYPIAINRHGTVVANAVGENGVHVSMIARLGQPWQRIFDVDGFYVNDINDDEGIAGTCHENGLSWPWFKPPRGPVRRLPYLQHHSCRIWAINNAGVIVGTAQADHGVHGLVWKPVV